MNDQVDTNKIAIEKVAKALRHIEMAQNHISQARAELSPIVFADKEYDMIGNHYDLTKALWRDVNFRIDRSKIDLDSDAKLSLKNKSTTEP